MLDDLRFPADHLAIAALKPPDTAACSHIHVVQSLAGEFLRPADIVDVVRVAAIDHNVTGVQLRRQFVQCRIHHRRRNHQPHGPRPFELLHQIIE
jgi:hypothetical protein